MEQIIVTVGTDGDVKVEVKGHRGPGCKALSQKIEQALGEVTKDEPTREMHQAAEETVRAVHRA